MNEILLFLPFIIGNGKASLNLTCKLSPGRAILDFEGNVISEATSAVLKYACGL